MPVNRLFAENAVPDSVYLKARDLNNNEKLTYYSMKIYDYARNNPFAAMTLIDSVLLLLNHINDVDDEVYALRGIGYYYLNQYKYDSSLYYLRLAKVANAPTHDAENYAGIYIDYGNIYLAQNLADSALHYYFLADSIAGQINDMEIKGIALVNIGSIYQNYKYDDEKSLDYLEAALRICDHASDLNNISMYQKLSIAYRHLNKDNLALETAQKSYDLAMKNGLLGDAAGAINSIGQIYKKQGDYKKAIEAFKEARRIAEKLNLKKGVIFTNGNIAEIYYETGRFKEGLEIYRNILKKAQDEGFIYIEMEIYQNMIRFYKEMNAYKPALELHEKIKILDDSLALADKENKIAELEARYQSKIKEETIARQQAQIKKDRVTIWLLAVIVLIVMVSLGIILWLYNLKNRSLKKLVTAHKDLSNKNKQIMKLIPGQPKLVNHENTDYIFQRIYHYLITNKKFLDENMSLDKLALETGINREYIRNAIKNTEECNFKSFLNNHRIDHAKNLIMEDAFNQLSIDEIAVQSGFSSRTSFYRTFRDITGFTPAYYKSQLQKHVQIAV